MAMTGAVRKLLMQHPEKFDVRDWMKPAREAMKEVCKARMESFGQAGNADKIKIKGVDEFKSYYA